MSRKIDRKIWENPPHLFGRQPGTRLVRLNQDRRRQIIRHISKPRTACHHTPLPEGLDMKDLMLATVEIRLTEGTTDGDGIRSCFLRFVEEVVCKLENNVGIGEGVEPQKR